MRAIPAVLLVIVLAALAAAAPAGAFAGDNGAVAYGWSSSDEPELGPARYEKAIRLIAARGGEPQTVVGCKQTVGVGAQLPTSGCLVETFADPAVSPNGQRIAFDNGIAIALVDVDGSDLRVLPTAGVDDGDPAFSPTGRRLAFSAGGGIWLRNLVTGAARQLSAEGTSPAWSSRDWIAFERDGEIWRVRPNGRGLRRIVAHGTAPVWSPRGTKLAFTRRHAIFVRTMRTGVVRRVWRLGGTVVDIAWSPNGRRFAVNLFDGGIWTARTNGADARQIVVGGVNATMNFGAGGVDWQPLR